MTRLLLINRMISRYYQLCNSRRMIKMECQLCNNALLLSVLFFSFCWFILSVFDSRKEVKYLLPINVIGLKELKPHQWVQLIHLKLKQIKEFTVTEAKTRFLGML